MKKRRNVSIAKGIHINKIVVTLLLEFTNYRGINVTFLKLSLKAVKSVKAFIIYSNFNFGCALRILYFVEGWILN